jgi:acyl-CoA synthetase (AMP-forming)/AMP-acid ligase II
MVGYLNAENPFDNEGWFCTGDKVEFKDEFIRFLGRESEMINVGGQKVSPSEVEAVILKDNNIKEATVYGRHHDIMGQVVMCRISLVEVESLEEVSKRLRKLCLNNLAKFKVPLRFEIIEDSEQHNQRFKKIRRIEE